MARIIFLAVGLVTIVWGATILLKAFRRPPEERTPMVLLGVGFVVAILPWSIAFALGGTRANSPVAGVISVIGMVCLVVGVMMARRLREKAKAKGAS